jgi:hypothetical protein
MKYLSNNFVQIFWLLKRLLEIQHSVALELSDRKARLTLLQ